MGATQIKNGYKEGSDDQLLVNPNGSINVEGSGGGGSVIVSGSVDVTNFPTVQIISGSVYDIQGTSPWIISGSVTSVISGSPTVLQGTNPWIVSGSVDAFQGGSPWVVSGSVFTVGSASVTGTVSTNINGLNMFSTTQYLVGTSAI